MASDPFDRVLGQPRVREFLRAVVASGRIGQAYLFTGPSGSNKTAAAYALAQAIVCERGGCGECDDCRRALRRSHPDIRFYAPEGASAYLVDQIREVVSDVSLAPIRAKRKVYIIDRADLLGASAANAFLKTLEEPPADVHLILLARTREGVLPTIVSRCQVVPFSHIPQTEAVGIICQNSGIPPERARIALAACDGSITRAIEFCATNDGFEFRAQVLEALAALETADDWDVLCLSKRLVERANVALDSARAAQEAELAQSAEFLSASAVRQIEARNKRALAAKSAEMLHRLSAVIASWARDVIVVSAGAEDLAVNVDALAQIRRAADRTTEARAASVVALTRRFDTAIAYNVSPQTSADALLFETREVLYGPDCTG